MYFMEQNSSVKLCHVYMDKKENLVCNKYYKSRVYVINLFSLVQESKKTYVSKLEFH